MMGVGFKVTYDYLADLCLACGWRLCLVRIGDDVFALRVVSDDRKVLLGGAKFRSAADLDVVAEVVFDVLHQTGLV
jgi:hypothetical protein